MTGLFSPATDTPSPATASSGLAFFEDDGLGEIGDVWGIFSDDSDGALDDPFAEMLSHPGLPLEGQPARIQSLLTMAELAASIRARLALEEAVARRPSHHALPVDAPVRGTARSSSRTGDLFAALAPQSAIPVPSPQAPRPGPQGPKFADPALFEPSPRHTRKKSRNKASSKSKASADISRPSLAPPPLALTSPVPVATAVESGLLFDGWFGAEKEQPSAPILSAVPGIPPDPELSTDLLTLSDQDKQGEHPGPTLDVVQDNVEAPSALPQKEEASTTHAQPDGVQGSIDPPPPQAQELPSPPARPVSTRSRLSPRPASPALAPASAVRRSASVAPRAAAANSAFVARVASQSPPPPPVQSAPLPTKLADDEDLVEFFSESDDWWDD